MELQNGDKVVIETEKEFCPLPGEQVELFSNEESIGLWSVREIRMGENNKMLVMLTKAELN